MEEQQLACAVCSPEKPVRPWQKFYHYTPMGPASLLGELVVRETVKGAGMGSQ
jgi:hypothetical protein